VKLENLCPERSSGTAVPLLLRPLLDPAQLRRAEITSRDHLAML